MKIIVFHLKLSPTVTLSLFWPNFPRRRMNGNKGGQILGPNSSTPTQTHTYRHTIVTYTHTGTRRELLKRRNFNFPMLSTRKACVPPPRFAVPHTHFEQTLRTQILRRDRRRAAKKVSEKRTFLSSRIFDTVARYGHKVIKRNDATGGERETDFLFVFC